MNIKEASEMYKTAWQQVPQAAERKTAKVPETTK